MNLGIERIEIVPAPAGKNRKRGPYWRCRCLRCGREDYIATSGDLNSGRIKSCGCYRSSEEFADLHVTHGHSRTSHGHQRSRTWRAWVEMRKRCLNPNATNWKWYGGKGIGFQKTWEKFENFLLDLGECPEGYELDRRDSAKHYTKENCRWVPAFFNKRMHGSNVTEELKKLW